jgi:hypothetical protein
MTAPSHLALSPRSLSYSPPTFPLQLPALLISRDSWQLAVQMDTQQGSGTLLQVMTAAMTTSEPSTSSRRTSSTSTTRTRSWHMCK